MSSPTISPFEIAVVNKTTQLSDLEVAKGASAVNRQVTEHAAPAWGRNIHVEYDARPEGLDWVIEIVDESTEEGAAGFHTITTDPGEFGRTIGQVALDNRFPWTAVLSHEVLEMLVNPSVGGIETNWNDGLLYAREICDPVQSTIYKIDNWWVSDFILPEWFMADDRHDDCAFWTKKVKPFEIIEGGWAIRWDQNFGDQTIFRATDGLANHYRADFARTVVEKLQVEKMAELTARGMQQS